MDSDLVKIAEVHTWRITTYPFVTEHMNFKRYRAKARGWSGPVRLRFPDLVISGKFEPLCEGRTPQEASSKMRKYICEAISDVSEPTSVRSTEEYTKEEICE